MIADGALVRSDGFTGLMQTIRVPAERLDVVSVDGSPEVEKISKAAISLRDHAAVIAFGGGSTLDFAKLMRAVSSGLDLGGIAGSTGGHVRLPDLAPSVPLIAIPTTLGTGSERNTNAVVTADGRRFLVSGEALLPDAAVLDPAYTRSLGAAATLAGIYEALARTIEPYTSPTSHPGADQLASATASRLVRIGEDILAAGPGPASVADDTLAEIAHLSGLSHAPAMHTGRNPFAFTGWYLAHELAAATGSTKVAALRAVLPAIDRRARAGRREWGPIRRRDAISAAALSGAAPGVASSGAGAGSAIRSAMDVLGERWSIAPIPGDIGGLDVAGLTTRIVSAWGAPFPHLGRVGADEVEAVLTDVRATAAFAHPAPHTAHPPAVVA